MAASLLVALICWPSVAGGADDLRRATVWDLKIGQPVAAQPAPDEFRGFACGSNGGPPRRRLAGWSDYMGCRPEASGLREVYFEYDDEYEYVARARDLPREIARWSDERRIRLRERAAGQPGAQTEEQDRYAWDTHRRRYLVMRSAPSMYGRSAAGIVTEPSFSW